MSAAIVAKWRAELAAGGSGAVTSVPVELVELFIDVGHYVIHDVADIKLEVDSDDPAKTRIREGLWRTVMQPVGGPSEEAELKDDERTSDLETTPTVVAETAGGGKEE
jgi:hypothetical protein